MGDAGDIMIVIGLVFGALSFFGFRHARRTADAETVTVVPADTVPAGV